MTKHDRQFPDSSLRDRQPSTTENRGTSRGVAARPPARTRRHLDPRWTAAFAAAAAVLLLAAGIAVEWGGLGASNARPLVAQAVPSAAVEGFRTQLASERLLPLAVAVRDGDLDGARAAWEALDAADRTPLGDADTVLGLAAYAAGDSDREAARRLLRRAPADGPLGDWRHVALAELAIRDGDRGAALEHYGALIGSHRGSPLRPQAMVAAADLHREMGSHHAALDLVRQARTEGVPAPQQVDLEQIAWEIGGARNDDATRREAARRLLILAPWRASALGASDLFLGGNGKVNWRGVLTGAELERRAATFLRLDQPDAARITLDDVPPGERGHDWHLLMAEAFTDLHRSREAMSVLDVAPIDDDAQRAAVEFRRGLAASDLGDPRGAGDDLSTERRRWMRAAARGHLDRAAALAGDDRLAADALRHLYDVLSPEDADARRRVLAAIRQHDPADRTGARSLWEDGWSAYRDGDADRAVALWNELAELYPGTRESHRGLYWQARALESLDRNGDARRVYDRLLESSDTTDFYRRQALVRVGSTPWLVGTAAEEVAELKPWEIAPVLERAKRLTDVGLEALAQRELELVATDLEGQPADDATALEALILSRRGEGRKAMGLLRRAYPQLGGPSQGAIPTEILRAYYPLLYADEIREGARRTGIPPYLLAGMIRQESAFDPRATSHVGARGLMQLMPPTAREVAQSLGESYDQQRLYDPAFSILLGSTYFSRVLEMFDGNVELALAGYNGGPNRIRRLWKEREPGAGMDDFLETLPIDESRIYVKRILVLADSYRRLYPEEEAVEPTPAG